MSAAPYGCVDSGPIARPCHGNTFQPYQHQTPTTQDLEHTHKLSLIGDLTCQHARCAMVRVHGGRHGRHAEVVAPIPGHPALYADPVYGRTCQSKRVNGGVAQAMSHRESDPLQVRSDPQAPGYRAERERTCIARMHSGPTYATIVTYSGKAAVGCTTCVPSGYMHKRC
jgi:hypothetical protein